MTTASARILPIQILPIQILRALAALLVVMHHAQFETAALALRTGRSFTPSTLLPWAAGVDVFFVISGFIIVHAAGPRTTAPAARTRFLAHRVARVVPLYWLVTALYLAVALAVPGLLGGAGGLDPDSIAASFLFWPHARPDGTVQPVYGLGWTLNCEMAFYALFAFGFGRGRRAATAWIVAALVMLVTLGAWLNPSTAALAFWSNPIMLEFALGALVALARAEGVRLSRSVRIGWALAALVPLAASTLAEGFPEGFLRPAILGLPAALLVGSAALGDAGPDGAGEPHPVRGALEALGNASYALYLIHPFVLRAVREGLARADAAIDPWFAVASMIALSAAAALLVHHYVERPLTLRVRRSLEARIRERFGKSGVRAADTHVPRRPDPH